MFSALSGPTDWILHALYKNYLYIFTFYLNFASLITISMQTVLLSTFRARLAIRDRDRRRVHVCGQRFNGRTSVCYQ